MGDERHELEDGYLSWLDEFRDRLRTRAPWWRDSRRLCVQDRRELRSVARCLRILRAVRDGAGLAYVTHEDRRDDASALAACLPHSSVVLDD